VNAWLWAAAGFLAGALPFSVWVGRLALGTDIRQYGDGNPGAFNVFRAGGKYWGWLAILLDGLKGAIPAALANFGFGWEGWQLGLAAVAPILGHAFSPFLGWRGGKALAVTFGVWTGLTLWVVPVILGAAFALGMLVLRRDWAAVLTGQAVLAGALLLLGARGEWWAVWGVSSVIFGWRYWGSSRSG
jgi:glycerol-3-phosphate acyltransferase PlsY